jgi:hypothetical protein
MAALTGLLWTGTGCEEAVDPVLDTDEAFSLYGFLDPSSDRQAVRVYSIDGVLQNTADQTMDAEVRSINRHSGEEVVWKDSIITFDDRSVGHVFHAPFQADFDTPYTLSATRSDGTTSSVDVRTPPDGDTVVSNIASARSQVVVELTWSNIPRIIQTEVSYFVRVPFPDGTDTTTVRVDIESGRAQENSNGTWSVFIIPSADIGVVFSALQLQPGLTPVFLDKIEARAFVTSADWESPVGIFDPELLVQPGTFSNVTGGFGFVGGGYFDRFEFVLDDSDARNAGYSVD